MVQGNEGLRRVLGQVLDRRERRGRLPQRMTVPSAPGLAEALRGLLSSRAVREAEGTIRLDLAAAARALGPEGEQRLEALLYQWTGRGRRDPHAEERARALALDRAIADLAPLARTATSRAALEDERRALSAQASEAALGGTSRPDDIGSTVEQLRRLVRCIDAALDNPEPVRVQVFSARVLGSSKALAWSGELFKSLGRALFEHHPPTRRAVLELGDPPSAAAAHALAVEACGLYRDGAAASALCFGPIVYRKAGERFDHVARHARLGECVRLVQSQLRSAELERPAAKRVTLVENLTPFLDHVDAITARGGEPDEIVILTSGQASWTVVWLLRLLAPFAIPTRHAGDLDRSGVLILRSLRRRVGRHILPWRMDVETHRRHAARFGIPLTAGERTRLRALLATADPGEPCHDLLVEIDRTGVWLEQEAFWDLEGEGG